MNRVLATSVIARLPLAMLSIALLVHARHLTGSFAAAGAVSAAYAASVGIGGPLLGRLVDRRGQTGVLAVSAAAAGVLLVAVAVLPAGAPPVVLVALAAGIGLATPPVGACVRSLLPASAYALDASAVELTFVAGPPLALGLGALWSTGAALGLSGAVILAGTAAFAAEPASRAWRPPEASRPRGGSLRAPAMRTLVGVMIAVGALFGAVEVAVTAAGGAAAAPLLALWGLGSLGGGAVAARHGGTGNLAAILAALTAGHLALAVAAGSPVALAVVLLVAGAAIAPTYASVYALVDRAAPAGTVTEAFAWLSTAVALGAAVGAASAGAIVDHAGPAAAFVLAGGAGAVATLLAQGAHVARTALVAAST